MNRSQFRADQALELMPTHNARGQLIQASAYDRIGRNALIYKPRIETRTPAPTLAQRIARAIIRAL